VRRLTGLTPTALLGGDLDRCLCGHDHSASYAPFLAARQPRASSKLPGASVRDPFKTREGARS
jgi:hypothetical protein